MPDEVKEGKTMEAGSGRERCESIEDENEN
jgi:hypothetical protein